MALIGYTRVPGISARYEAAQLAVFEDNEVDRYYVDKYRGQDETRPELNAMLDSVQKGDTVLVSDYAHLAKSVKDLLNIVNILTEKGVQLKVIKEKFDTTTPKGMLMLEIFEDLNNFEHEMVLGRQRLGIQKAKEEGKYKGRQPMPYDEDLFETEVIAWKCGKQNAKTTMEKLDMKPNRFYRKVKEYYKERVPYLLSQAFPLNDDDYYDMWYFGSFNEPNEPQTNMMKCVDYIRTRHGDIITGLWYIYGRSKEDGLRFIIRSVNGPDADEVEDSRNALKSFMGASTVYVIKPGDSVLSPSAPIEEWLELRNVYAIFDCDKEN